MGKNVVAVAIELDLILLLLEHHLTYVKNHIVEKEEVDTIVLTKKRVMSVRWKKQRMKLVSCVLFCIANL